VYASPERPEAMNWSVHYPALIFGKPKTEDEDGEKQSQDTNGSKRVEVADIGCGFGGLLFALAPKMPDTLILGTVS